MSQATSGTTATTAALQGPASTSATSANIMPTSNADTPRRSHLVKVLDLDMSSDDRKIEALATKVFMSFPLGRVIYGADLAYGKQNLAAWDEYWYGIDQEIKNSNYWHELVPFNDPENKPLESARPLDPQTATMVTMFPEASVSTQNIDTIQETPDATQNLTQDLQTLDPAILNVGKCVVVLKEDLTSSPVTEAAMDLPKVICRTNGPPVDISNGIQTHKKKAKSISSVTTKSHSKKLNKQRKQKSTAKDAVPTEVAPPKSSDVATASATIKKSAMDMSKILVPMQQVSQSSSMLHISPSKVIRKYIMAKKHQQLRDTYQMLAQTMGACAIKDNSFLYYSSSALPMVVYQISQPPIVQKLQEFMVEQLRDLEMPLPVLKYEILHRLTRPVTSKVPKQTKPKTLLPPPAIASPIISATSAKSLLSHPGENIAGTLVEPPMKSVVVSPPKPSVDINTKAIVKSLKVPSPKSVAEIKSEPGSASAKTQTRQSSKKTLIIRQKGKGIVANEAEQASDNKPATMPSSSKDFQPVESTVVAEAIQTHKKKQKKPALSRELAKYLKQLNDNKTSASLSNKKDKKKRNSSKANPAPILEPSTSESSASSTTADTSLSCDGISSSDSSIMEDITGSPFITTFGKADIKTNGAEVSPEELRMTHAGPSLVTDQEPSMIIENFTAIEATSLRVYTDLVIYQVPVFERAKVQYEFGISTDYFKLPLFTPFLAEVGPETESPGICTDSVLSQPFVATISAGNDFETEFHGACTELVSFEPFTVTIPAVEYWTYTISELLKVPWLEPIISLFIYDDPFGAMPPIDPEQVEREVAEFEAMFDQDEDEVMPYQELYEEFPADALLNCPWTKLATEWWIYYIVKRAYTEFKHEPELENVPEFANYLDMRSTVFEYAHQNLVINFQDKKVWFADPREVVIPGPRFEEPLDDEVTLSFGRTPDFSFDARTATSFDFQYRSPVAPPVASSADIPESSSAAGMPFTSTLDFECLNAPSANAPESAFTTGVPEFSPFFGEPSASTFNFGRANVTAAEVPAEAPVMDVPTSGFAFGAPSASPFNFNCGIPLAADAVPRYSPSFMDLMTERSTRNEAFSDFLFGAEYVPQPAACEVDENSGDSEVSELERQLEEELLAIANGDETGRNTLVEKKLDEPVVEGAIKPKTMVLQKQKGTVQEPTCRRLSLHIHKTRRGNRAVSMPTKVQRVAIAPKLAIPTMMPIFKAPLMLPAPQPIKPTLTPIQVLSDRLRRVPFTIYFFPELDINSPGVTTNSASPVVTADEHSPSGSSEASASPPDTPSGPQVDDSIKAAKTKKPSLIRKAWNLFAKPAKIAAKVAKMVAKPTFNFIVKPAGRLILAPALYFIMKWLELNYRIAELWLTHHRVGL